MDNRKLFQKLLKWIKHNDKADLICYLRRLTLIHAIIMQKLNINQEVTTSLFFGRKMRVVSGETVSSVLIGFGYTEVALTALMLSEIKEGNNIVDIGTHYGYEAMLASKLVGNSGTVVSFEPNPHSYSIAQKNLTGKNAKLYNYAVGDYNGVAKMNNNHLANSAFNGIVNDQLSDRIIAVPINFGFYP